MSRLCYVGGGADCGGAAKTARAAPLARAADPHDQLRSGTHFSPVAIRYTHTPKTWRLVQKGVIGHFRPCHSLMFHSERWMLPWYTPTAMHIQLISLTQFICHVAHSSISRLCPQVLVRLKVDHTGFPALNNQRFGARFVGQVANPTDILLFHKRKKVEERYVGPRGLVRQGERRGGRACHCTTYLHYNAFWSMSCRQDGAGGSGPLPGHAVPEPQPPRRRPARNPRYGKGRDREGKGGHRLIRDQTGMGGMADGSFTGTLSLNPNPMTRRTGMQISLLKIRSSRTYVSVCFIYLCVQWRTWCVRRSRRRTRS